MKVSKSQAHFCKSPISLRHLEIVKSGFFMLFYQQIVQIWESKYQLSKVTKPIKFNHCTLTKVLKLNCQYVNLDKSS